MNDRPSDLDNAHSPVVEAAVLGPVLVGRHKGAAAILIEHCPLPEYFFQAKHQYIVRAIFALVGTGKDVDAVGVIDALSHIRYHDARTTRRWQREDGIDARDTLAAYVTPNDVLDLVGAHGSIEGLAANCKRLAAFYRQRQAIDALTATLEDVKGKGGHERCGPALDRLITTAASVLGNGQGSSTMEEAIQAALDAHDRAKASGQPIALASWGEELPELDRRLPLRPGRLIVLGANSGCGKTSLMLQAAHRTSHMRGAGSVAIVSRETTGEELASILIAREIRASVRSIEQGGLTAEQRAAAEEYRKRWLGTNIAIKEMGGRCAIEDLLSWIRQRHIRSGGALALVALDYLQLVDASHDRQTDFDRITKTTRALKLLANELRICILAISQLNREGKKSIRDRKGRVESNPEPTPEDLKGSSSIEQDADGILLIWSEAVDTAADPLPVHLKVAKNRGGRTGSLLASFEKSRGQVFVQSVGMAGPGGTPSPDPEADSKRAHHNHPPQASEDKFRRDLHDDEPPEETAHGAGGIP